MTVRRLLFAVWLVDYAVDVKGAENSGGATIGDNNYAVATRCDKRVISLRNGIFTAVRSADQKWYESRCQKAFTNIGNHELIISKTSPPALPAGR